MDQKFSDPTGSSTTPSGSDPTHVDSVDVRRLHRRVRRLRQQRRLHLIRQLRRQRRFRRRRVVLAVASSFIAVVGFASGYASRALVDLAPTVTKSTEPSALSDPRTAAAVAPAPDLTAPHVAPPPAPAQQAPASTEPAAQSREHLRNEESTRPASPAQDDDRSVHRERPPRSDMASRERAQTAGDRDALQTALNAWLASARAGDIDRHMSFYLRTVSVFYHKRQVSRAAVRAEKQRAFGQAETVKLTASEPSITISRDGKLATMRFRKQYVIAGPRMNRSGEVLQEIVWVRTTDYGWRIYAERDIAVVPLR